jgi:DNA-binding MarR family transcriptional regulator
VSSDVSGRPRYIGALMRVGWQWVRAQVFESVRAAGYDDLNPAHVSLFRHPTLDGLRPIDIAERMQITKQSVHELLTHMERQGYLVREPDPTNRRARVVRLTESGRRLERVVGGAARAAEEQIAAMLGERRFNQLRDALRLLVEKLDAPQPSAGGTTEPTDLAGHREPRRR